LVKGRSPNIARRSFSVTATFDAQGKDGVIVAQGGSGQGSALYVQQGNLFFAVRRAKFLTTVSAGEIPAGLHTAKARLKRSGDISLSFYETQPDTAQHT